MIPIIRLILGVVFSLLRSRARLQAENLALRHQLCVLHRRSTKPKTRPVDRIIWSVLSKIWPSWRDSLIIVKPDTVLRWLRKRFRDHWAKLSSRRGGRPKVSKEIRNLIRTMSVANPLWGYPHIHGELSRLGIELSKSTVEKYMVRVPKRPSATWRSFLKNHGKEIVSIDFLVVPTIRFKLLYVLVFLSIERRRVVHFNVTEHPTAEWTGEQVVQAFPWDTAPKYLLRDRDSIYGEAFKRRVYGFGISEVLTAPRSPWQNPYSERLNGTIRRECLDHIILFSEAHLRRVLAEYFQYYNRYRVHQSLEMDAPDGREIQAPYKGDVVAIPHVGGLHHHY